MRIDRCAFVLFALALGPAARVATAQGSAAVPHPPGVALYLGVSGHVVRAWNPDRAQVGGFGVALGVCVRLMVFPDRGSGLGVEARVGEVAYRSSDDDGYLASLSAVAQRQLSSIGGPERGYLRVSFGMLGSAGDTALAGRAIGIAIGGGAVDTGKSSALRPEALVEIEAVALVPARPRPPGRGTRFVELGSVGLAGLSGVYGGRER